MTTKPKSAKTTKRKRSSKPKWVSVELTDMPAEHQVLTRSGKDDRKDLSQNLVRSRRFRSSYMMATNGGATYEDILRPLPEKGQRGPLPHLDRGDSSPLENVIGPTDDRELILDTSRVPARSIGLLEIFPEHGPQRYGTAWLIGPRTLATAAHNLVHPDPNIGEAQSMRVGLACDGTSARGGWHKVIDCAFESGWRTSMEAGSPFDFAVLKIDDGEVGEKLGWFGFADYEDAKFGELIVNIFGYPMDKRQFHMYGAAGRVRRVDEGALYYDCDAGGGMSGGPVIARFGEQRIAVGVHVAGGLTSNVGTRINNLAYALFNEHRDW